MNKKYIITKSVLGVTLAIACSLIASPVAAVSVDASAAVNVNTSIGNTSIHARGQANGNSASSTARADARAQIKDKTIVKAKDKGDQEIARRIDALTKLKTRVNEMKNISASGKTSLQAQIDAQVTALTTLKTKIDIESDVPTLRTDIKSISASYRIFALILPQDRIIGAVDRVNTIVNLMTTTGLKLQSKINEAQSAGKDGASAQTSLNEYNAKIADAKVQGQAALTVTTSLKPDNGDQSTFDSNKDTLKDAESKIKVALQDIKTAREDINKILSGIKNVKTTTTASSTVTAQ